MSMPGAGALIVGAFLLCGWCMAPVCAQEHRLLDGHVRSDEHTLLDGYRLLDEHVPSDGHRLLDEHVPSDEQRLNDEPVRSDEPVLNGIVSKDDVYQTPHDEAVGTASGLVVDTVNSNRVVIWGVATYRGYVMMPQQPVYTHTCPGHHW